MAQLAVYRIDIYDDAGSKKGCLTGTAAGGIARKSGFLSFSCVKRVNDIGLLTIYLRGDHAILSELSDKWQFELWRKPAGRSWVREFVGIFRSGNWRYDNKSNIVLYCPGVLSLLAMRVINYPSNMDNRTKYEAVPAETIAKSMVTYNSTSAATTANGRKRNGTAWPANQITVEADDSGGAVLNWYTFGKVLLDGLKALAKSGGGDFDLVKTSATAYEFRWYDGQLGDDMSASIKFSLTLGNMGSPQVTTSWSDEKTVACVWGQGDDDLRDYLTVTGANYSAENDIEMFVNASDIEHGDTEGLQARGEQKAAESQATRQFRFTALQAPATLYGVHYQLGDLVTATDPLNGNEYIQKVEAVILTWSSDGQQNVSTELGAVNAITGS